MEDDTHQPPHANHRQDASWQCDEESQYCQQRKQDYPSRTNLARRMLTEPKPKIKINIAVD